MTKKEIEALKKHLDKLNDSDNLVKKYWGWTVLEINKDIMKNLIIDLLIAQGKGPSSKQQSEL